MLADVIKRLELEGKIRKQKVGLVQIESLLKQAILYVNLKLKNEIVEK